LEVDCNPDDGKTVFEKLTCVNHFTQEEFIDEMPPVEENGILKQSF
jgi:hypothetical protein